MSSCHLVNLVNLWERPPGRELPGMMNADRGQEAAPTVPTPHPEMDSES
jgi:hypothetical protein